MENSPADPDENVRAPSGATLSSDDSELASFVEQICLPFLHDTQNEDGGWPFLPGRESRVEPTAWASLALQEFASHTSVQGLLDRALRFLASAQLGDGGWPAAPGVGESCWVTSLACWALGAHDEYAANLTNGIRWLTSDKPADSVFWWRTGRMLFTRMGINDQSAALSGWSWTPHTASWVEPTAYAMIVEQSRPSESPGVARRYKVAEQMLYDRMCPGGGWNCGNPRVYGVAGQPQVGPTVWALVALRANRQRNENLQSLDWLAATQVTIKSPESLALAHIGLGLYGSSSVALAESLRSQYASATLPWSVEAISWTALAFSETSRWLNVVRQGKS